MIERVRMQTVAGAVVLVAALSVGLTALTTRPARAQFFWDQPRYSADDIARIAMQHGFRPMAPPVRNDSVYLADVVDQRGRRERLVVNAESGEILQRFYLDYGHRYRRYADPSLPRGPIPPDTIPNENGDDGSLVTRLAPDDGAVVRPPPAYEPQQDDMRPRRPRRPRSVERAPERPFEPPVESAPLAPATPAPAVLRPPKPAVPAATQAALPPSTPAEAVKQAPPVDAKPGRPISHDPLAIPGSREQDQATAGAKPNTAAATDKKVAPPKAAVPVVPLE